MSHQFLAKVSLIGLSGVTLKPWSASLAVVAWVASINSMNAFPPEGIGRLNFNNLFTETFNPENSQGLIVHIGGKCQFSILSKDLLKQIFSTCVRKFVIAPLIRITMSLLGSELACAIGEAAQQVRV